jgi:hypothetical protein
VIGLPAGLPAVNGTKPCAANRSFFFQGPSSNWKLAAAAQADLDKDEVLTTKDGTGLLVNLPGKKGAKDLYTKATYGDMDLELDYMMAKGSNSGIYLQGRYEIQLLDSWGKG